MVKLNKKTGVAKRVCRQHTGVFGREWRLPQRDDKTMAQLCQDFTRFNRHLVRSKLPWVTLTQFLYHS